MAAIGNTLAGMKRSTVAPAVGVAADLGAAAAYAAAPAAGGQAVDAPAPFDVLPHFLAD